MSFMAPGNTNWRCHIQTLSSTQLSRRYSGDPDFSIVLRWSPTAPQINFQPEQSNDPNDPGNPSLARLCKMSGASSTDGFRRYSSSNFAMIVLVKRRLDSCTNDSDMRNLQNSICWYPKTRLTESNDNLLIRYQ